MSWPRQEVMSYIHSPFTSRFHRIIFFSICLFNVSVYTSIILLKVHTATILQTEKYKSCVLMKNISWRIMSWAIFEMLFTHFVSTLIYSLLAFKSLHKWYVSMWQYFFTFAKVYFDSFVSKQQHNSQGKFRYGLLVTAACSRAKRGKETQQI